MYVCMYVHMYVLAHVHVHSTVSIHSLSILRSYVFRAFNLKFRADGISS